MMLKTVMEVAEGYTVFNHGTQRPQKYIKFQDRTIMAGAGVNMSPKMFLPGNSKYEVGK